MVHYLDASRPSASWVERQTKNLARGPGSALPAPARISHSHSSQPPRETGGLLTAPAYPRFVLRGQRTDAPHPVETAGDLDTVKALSCSGYACLNRVQKIGYGREITVRHLGDFREADAQGWLFVRRAEVDGTGGGSLFLFQQDFAAGSHLLLCPLLFTLTINNHQALKVILVDQVCDAFAFV